MQLFSTKILLSASLSIGLFASGCNVSKTPGIIRPQQITLKNTASIDLKDKAISISRNRLRYRDNSFPLIISSNRDTIACQLDDTNGDSKWDELFFVADIPAKASISYTLTWVNVQPTYVKRTSVRFGKRMSANAVVEPATNEIVYKNDLPKTLGFQRYQTDGPTWENDKVGFRHYLDGRNAKDVFGKKVSYISPENVGINAKGAVEDNYHVMEAWGRDVMAVQNSIGIGGIALKKQDSILRLGVTVDDAVNNVEKTTFNIVTEGPVRSMLQLDYNNWKPANNAYNATETISITPGMYAYQNKVNINGLTGDENLLIGMVSIFATHPPEEVRVNNQWVALVSHDRHSYNKEWWLPLALIVPANAYIGLDEAPKTGKLSNSYFAKMKVSNNQPISYYSVAAWEGSDAGFKDPVYFKNYVQELMQQLATDVIVTIK